MARAAGGFTDLRQVEAGVLNVGYVDAGPPDGDAGDPPARLALRHPQLRRRRAAARRRRSTGSIVPYLRGYGTTRFLSDDTMRNGEPAAMGLDLIALMDALNIDTAKLAGFDWGARTADVVAALWPERCRGLVSVSGYLIDSQEAGKVAAAAEGGVRRGGTSTTSPPSAAGKGTTRTGATSPS